MVKYDIMIAWTFSLNMYVIMRIYRKYVQTCSLTGVKVKLNLSLSDPFSHTEGVKIHRNLFSSRYYLRVSDQLHVTPALPGERILLSIEYVAFYSCRNSV